MELNAGDLQAASQTVGKLKAVREDTLLDELIVELNMLIEQTRNTNSSLDLFLSRAGIARGVETVPFPPTDGPEPIGFHNVGSKIQMLKREIGDLIANVETLNKIV